MSFLTFKSQVWSHCLLVISHQHDDAIIQKINESGAELCLSLGCPKQEYWMNQNKDKIQAVMIGLGSFPYLLQEFIRAPLWMRESGLSGFTG